MKKKAIFIGGIISTMFIGLVGLSAFEAHIINVTAEVENGLTVSNNELKFGTVIPQEYLEKDFSISLSGSFLASERLDGVSYEIIQRPKPIFPEPLGCKQQFSDLTVARTYCVNNPEDYNCCYYNLCPFLSKNDADPEDMNDVGHLSYFWGDYCEFSNTQASGKLVQGEGDIEDNWVVDLKVPPVYGFVDLEWPANCPTISREAEYGCDLYIQVKSLDEEGNT